MKQIYHGEATYPADGKLSNLSERIEDAVKKRLQELGFRQEDEITVSRINPYLTIKKERKAFLTSEDNFIIYTITKDFKYETIDDEHPYNNAKLVAVTTHRLQLNGKDKDNIEERIKAFYADTPFKPF